MEEVVPEITETIEPSKEITPEIEIEIEWESTPQSLFTFTIDPEDNNDLSDVTYNSPPLVQTDSADLFITFDIPDFDCDCIEII